MGSRIALGAMTGARREAVEAGATALRRGGNAIDAAVAAGFSLCVADPANCGLGGYGGCATIQLSGGVPLSVGFNAGVPAAFRAELLDGAPRVGGQAVGAVSVAVPQVLRGLVGLHTDYGTLPLPEVIGPAASLARNGVRVGEDLRRALTACWGFLAAGTRTLLSGPDDQPPAVGTTLRQNALADTLEWIAASPKAAVAADGVIADAVLATVRDAGGVLTRSDFERSGPAVVRSPMINYKQNAVFGPEPQETGFEVLSEALRCVGRADLPASDDSRDVTDLAAALRKGWDQRWSRLSPLKPEGGKANAAPIETTHLCAVDASGNLVSMTLTHGPVWFGSGLANEDLGIILNCGANVFFRDTRGQIVPANNMCPIIVHQPDGRRYALGSPGGVRIPAIILQAIVRLARDKAQFRDAFTAPRVSVGKDGRLEVERTGNWNSLPDRHDTIDSRDFFGPANGISFHPGSGEAQAAMDNRFECASWLE